LKIYTEVCSSIEMLYDNFLYIDPGSMSALAATIIGALVGLGMYVKIKWQSLKFRNKINK